MPFALRTSFRRLHLPGQAGQGLRGVRPQPAIRDVLPDGVGKARVGHKPQLRCALAPAPAGHLATMHAMRESRSKCTSARTFGPATSSSASSMSHTRTGTGFSNALFAARLDGTPYTAEQGRNTAPDGLDPAFGCRLRAVADLLGVDGPTEKRPSRASSTGYPLPLGRFHRPRNHREAADHPRLEPSWAEQVARVVDRGAIAIRHPGLVSVALHSLGMGKWGWCRFSGRVGLRIRLWGDHSAYLVHQAIQ